MSVVSNHNHFFFISFVSLSLTVLLYCSLHIFVLMFLCLSELMCYAVSLHKLPSHLSSLSNLITDTSSPPHVRITNSAISLLFFMLKDYSFSNHLLVMCYFTSFPIFSASSFPSSYSYLDSNTQQSFGEHCASEKSINIYSFPLSLKESVISAALNSSPHFIEEKIIAIQLLRLSYDRA